MWKLDYSFPSRLRLTFRLSVTVGYAYMGLLPYTLESLWHHAVNCWSRMIKIRRRGARGLSSQWIVEARSRFAIGGLWSFSRYCQRSSALTCLSEVTYVTTLIPLTRHSVLKKKATTCSNTHLLLKRKVRRHMHDRWMWILASRSYQSSQPGFHIQGQICVAIAQTREIAGQRL